MVSLIYNCALNSALCCLSGLFLFASGRVFSPSNQIYLKYMKRSTFTGALYFAVTLKKTDRRICTRLGTALRHGYVEVSWRCDACRVSGGGQALDRVCITLRNLRGQENVTDGPSAAPGWALNRLFNLVGWSGAGGGDVITSHDTFGSNTSAV